MTKSTVEVPAHHGRCKVYSQLTRHFLNTLNCMKRGNKNVRASERVQLCMFCTTYKNQHDYLLFILTIKDNIKHTIYAVTELLWVIYRECMYYVMN